MPKEVANSIKLRYLSFCYFTIANSLLVVILSSLYFFAKFRNYSLPEYSLTRYVCGITYTLANHFSMVVLCFLVISLVVLPTILIKNKLRLIIQAIFAAVIISLLLLDSYIFYLDGVHITDIFADLSNLFINDLSLFINNFSVKKAIVVLILLITAEYYFANKIVAISYLQNSKIVKKFMLFVIIILASSQLIYGFAKRNSRSFSFSSHLPFQYRNNSWLQNLYPELTKINKSNLKQINYPLKPLATTTVIKPKNILIIALDAWRADCFNKNDTPNMWQLAQQGTIFNNHISTANHTRHGLFGLFYSIPSTHWYNFLIQQKSPIFIDRLQQLNYQLGVFISTQVKEDKLDKTIFSKITNLRMHSAGNTPSEWDQNTTDDWLNWYKNLDKTKPWFAFVFYYAAHDHDFPADYTDQYAPTAGKIRYADLAKLQGEVGMHASYKIAVNYVDSLAKKIITTIANNQQLQDTLVIITSDHGHELNDNLQGHWGHSSNFTASQLQVPFAIIGDKFNNSTTETKRTTHYDLIPTLMTNFLGVTNNSIDYAIGNDLLTTNRSDYYSIAASTRWGSIFNSMLSFALVDNDFQAIKIFASGKYQLFDKYNRQIPNNLNKHDDNILQAIQHLTRYLK